MNFFNFNTLEDINLQSTLGDISDPVKYLMVLYILNQHLQGS